MDTHPLFQLDGMDENDKAQLQRMEEKQKENSAQLRRIEEYLRLLISNMPAKGRRIRPIAD